ncbi:MAG: XdhC family protein [Deltaproteobacteria bacterium]|nr:XdhC family protein [Deltaproteobacteria bacterium]
MVSTSTKRALAWVVDVRGSSPQRIGAKIWVDEDGAIEGTVGGGAVEARVIEEARAVARDGGFRLLKLHLTAELAMCCGGSMEFAIAAVDESNPFFAELRSGVALPRTWSCVLEGDGRGRLGWGPLVGDRVYREDAVPAPRLLVFGAGHVAHALAPFATELGFSVVVIDDRPEWASAARFPNCECRLQTAQDFFFGDAIRSTDWIVIVTRSHALDQEILERVAPERCVYVGMIGSQRKVERAKMRARSAGLDADALARIHAPIGLSLGAVTPAEIAVSIAAELVKVRRGAK